MDASHCLMLRDTPGLVVNQIEPEHTSAAPMDASNRCLSMSDAQRVPVYHTPVRAEPWGGVSQNLSSVTNDSFCYKLLKSLLLIGCQQICH